MLKFFNPFFLFGFLFASWIKFATWAFESMDNGIGYVDDEIRESLRDE